MTDDPRPKPPIAADVDLRDYRWMPLDVVRLWDSDLAICASAEGFRAAVLLWCKAWHQVPAGSLPNDGRALARLAGCDLSTWDEISNEALRNFIECSDGRLYHPVVCEKALEAWEERRGKPRHGVAGAVGKWGTTSKSAEHGRTRAQRLAKAREKGTHTDEEWRALLDILGNRCLICGTSGDDTQLVKDHITPIYQGGSDACENLQPLCRSCNSRKGADVTDHRLTHCPDWKERLLERLQMPTDACGTPAKRLAKDKERERENPSVAKATSGPPDEPTADPADDDDDLLDPFDRRANPATDPPADSASDEVLVFREGKALLGQNAGGLIAKLVKTCRGDHAEALRTVREATGKQDPREWLGRVIAEGTELAEADREVEERLAQWKREFEEAQQHG